MDLIKPFYLDLTDEEITDIQKKTGEILRSGNLILGKYTQEFEEKFADYIGTKYAVSMNTCTSALEALFMLKKIKGKKIAVQTNTNFATVAAIIHAGGIPVFMDMDPGYFAPNLEILDQTIKKDRTISGVAWVHIGGIIHPEFKQIVEYCKSKKIFLIEDCAHAHGSQLNGTKAGNFADGGAFSFFPTKVMTTMEGGMITTNNEEDANIARSLRNQGKRGGDYGGLHTDLGSSWRMSEVSAYMGLVQLKKLDKMISHREAAIKKLIPTLDSKGIEYCDTSHMDKCAQYKFIIKYKNTEHIDVIKDKFMLEGIVLGGGVYEVPCHLQPVFSDIPYLPDSLKNSEEFCSRHICPPITSGTTELDIERIATAIEKYIY
jgi:dTDP-4-amino-4,6-dideoxygalactose transaminase